LPEDDFFPHPVLQGVLVFKPRLSNRWVWIGAIGLIGIAFLLLDAWFPTISQGDP
jgi:hypothetical protein